jgi:tetratricopeptide (TPR) repeat protein
VNVLLVDAADGHELWAERYDRQLQDIFAVQDEVTQTIAANLKVRIEATERQNALRADPAGLAAYGFLLRGHEIFHKYTKTGNSKARQLYKRALDLDPVFCRAYAALSKTHNIDWRYSWSRSPSGSLALALELAERAVDLDELDARGHGELGFAYLYHRQVDRALAEYERARTLNPNDADILAETADALIYDGRPADSLPLFEQAIRLNPYHPDWYLWYYGSAMFQLQLYSEAIATLSRMRDPSQARRLLAASHAYLGHSAEAERYARELMSKQPGFTVAYWATTQPFKNRTDLEHFTEGLRRAGVP